MDSKTFTHKGINYRISGELVDSDFGPELSYHIINLSTKKIVYRARECCDFDLAIEWFTYDPADDF